MTAKLYKAADVCVLAQVQPYVLRSWEKEFPGIGVQKSPDGPRLYRQADVDQVLRIKQLVFGEGLTLSGARRKLEEAQPPAGPDEAQEAGDEADVLEALPDDARTRIASVCDGLRSILTLLSSAPGSGVGMDDFALQAPAAGSGERSRAGAARSRAVKTSESDTGTASKRRRASA